MSRNSRTMLEAELSKVGSSNSPAFTIPEEMDFAKECEELEELEAELAFEEEKLKCVNRKLHLRKEIVR